jgi:hypothetical protein
MLVLGCAPRGEPADSVPSPAGAVPSGAGTVGTVRIVGSAPMNVQVVLQPDTGRSISLTGSLRAELEQLAGARVAVEGEIARSADPIVDRSIEATRYTILAVNGRPVVTGEIVSMNAGIARLRTESGEQIELRGVPDSFRVGQKVWVQGPKSLTVQTYGLIR